jgi:hypothetical protein
MHINVMHVITDNKNRQKRAVCLSGGERCHCVFVFDSLSVPTLSSHPRIGHISLPVPLHKRLRLYTKREVIERKSLAARRLSSITFI